MGKEGDEEELGRKGGAWDGVGREAWRGHTEREGGREGGSKGGRA
jgi:hypothetical protein